MASALHLTGLAALVAVAYLAGWAIYNVYLHPLAKVPGPKHLALSPFFREHHKIGGRWDHVLAALHEEYGPAVRFGPNQVSFITPDAWKTLYGHQSGAKQPPIKDPGFYFHDDGAASHIINANKEDHRRMRRVLAHAFSEKALRGQEDIIQHYTSLFINHMKAKAANAESFDIVLWYNFTTFDLIGDLAFGKPFGMLESGTYHPWVAMIFETLTMLPYLQIVSRFPALNGGDEKALAVGISEAEMIENAGLLIIAGSETTATQLSGTTFYLLSNPRTYDRLVAEIRGAFASEDDINMTTVAHLEYLAAVFNESFRMYPPVPIDLPRLIGEGGETVEGHFLPPKTSASVHQWSAYQSKHNFFEPKRFLPERWLTSVNTTDPRFVHDRRDVLQPFSTGPANCIGKNLAYAEMRVILCRLLYNFDLELQPESKDWANQRILMLWEKGPLNVKLTAVKR